MELLKQQEVPELKAIERSEAQQIRETFVPMAEMLEDFEEAYNMLMEESKNGITEHICTRAKRLRLDVAQVRIQTGKAKDKAKEYLKLKDKAIMGVHNILVYAVKEKEDNLKEIENYFEIQEAKRLEALQKKRVEQLSPYVENAEEISLSSMDEDVWKAYFEGKKKEHEDRIKAEQEAERQRIEQERIAALHEKRRTECIPYYRFWGEEPHFGVMEEDEYKKFLARVKKEQAAYDSEQEELRKEKERLEKEAEQQRTKAKAEQEAREKKEAEEKAKHEAALKAEREKQQELERQLKAKEEAERKAREEAEAKRQAELAKGDEAKVEDLISDLESIKTKYQFSSAANKKMYQDVNILIDKVVVHIKKHS